MSEGRRAPVKKTVMIDADVYELIELWRRGQGPGGKDETWQEALNIMARRGLAAQTPGPRKSAPVSAPATVPLGSPTNAGAPPVGWGGEGRTTPLDHSMTLDEEMAVALRILSYLAACVPAAQHNRRDRVVEREIVGRFRQKVREGE